jgi:hypothetical protein
MDMGAFRVIENATFHEQIPPLVRIPKKWFCFAQASPDSIKVPISFPFFIKKGVQFEGEVFVRRSTCRCQDALL